MIAVRRTSCDCPRGFSLIELLIAIFILGVGAISIAALFPAGITQQRRTVDDGVGTIVAASAISTLRAKLDRSDFGTFDEFLVFPPRATIPGDWPWLRPSFIFENEPMTPDVDETGAIDVFSADWTDGTSTKKATEFHAFANGYEDGGAQSVPPLMGIPYSKWKYGNEPPRIIFTRRERYYPQAPEPALGTSPDPRPQYVWDCMFRRFEGRIEVAIFVYRAALSGGGSAATPYSVPQSPTTPPLHENLPPIPVRIALDKLGDGSGSPYWQGGVPSPEPRLGWDAYGPDFIGGTPDDALVLGTDPCDDYNPFDLLQTWQEPGQWILDQNNNVHRVLSSYCPDDPDQNPRQVEMVRPIPHVPVQHARPPCGNPSLPAELRLTIPCLYWLPWFDGGECDEGMENVVSDIWYVPTLFRGEDGREWELTPVYVGVMEL